MEGAVGMTPEQLDEIERRWPEDGEAPDAEVRRLRALLADVFPAAD
jgi:hypothetical protein